MPNWKLPGEKTPVTVITGFLGSGKTTLLNHLLRNKADRNVAVVENEFGEVNIDRELVVENVVEKENLVTMSNGCVCCSLRKDIVRAFAIIERQTRVKHIDSVILETTGLADPAPVAFTFFANPWIASRFKLDSIICLVDCKYLLQHLQDAEHMSHSVNEAVQQIAFADLILLNKVDLVDEEKVKSVLESIRHINKTARVIETSFADDARKPPVDSIMGTGLFSVNRALEVDPHFLDSEDLDDVMSDGEEEPGMRGDDPCASPRSHQADTPCSADSAAINAKAAAEAAAAAQTAAGDAEHQGQADSAAAERTSGGAQPGPGSQQTAAAAAARGASDAKRRSHAHGHGHNHARSSGAGEGGTDKEEAGGDGAAVADAHLDQPPTGLDDFELAHPLKGDRAPRHRTKRMHDLSDVSSVGITAHGELDEYRFNMFMRDLLAEKAKDILRCKGFLAIHGYGNAKFVFQGVHDTICYGPAEHPFQAGEEKANQVVFIGRGLNRKSLSEGFRSCVWVPLPEGWEEFKDPSTKQSFYVNRESGEKTWVRPEPSPESDQGPEVLPEVNAIQTHMEQRTGSHSLRRAKVPKLA